MGLYHIGKRITQTLHILIICIVCLGLFLPPSFAEDISEDNVYDLILEVKRDRATLSAALIGLEKDEKYYIPLQELARIIQFHTDTDIANGTAEGFFATEDNSYRLDIPNRTYTVQGKTESLGDGDAFLSTQKFGIGDIYITPDLANKIWPLQLTLNTLTQTLNIGAKQKLPYQLFMERERLRNKRMEKFGSKTEVNIQGLPRLDNGYKLFSLPAVDLSTSTQVGNGNGGFNQSLNVSGRNDLLKTQASYNFSFSKNNGDKRKLENARFMLEKQSFEEGDLPLGLKLFQAGDIRPRPSRLIDGSLVGRGLLFSTESQKQTTDFDDIIVEGFAEPGWEVELYRNEELIDFQTVNAQGEYRFENVSLNYNNTRIRTVLYGPEGQIRENEENYNITDAMLQPGKTTFEASLLDLNRDLILSANRPKTRPEGLAQNYKVKHGITPWLSAFSTLTAMPTPDKNRRYGSLGVNLSFFNVSSLVEAYHDFSGGGSALDFRAAGRFAGTNLNFRAAKFSDFESEEARYGAAARKSRVEISASRPFKLPFGNIGLRIKADLERFVDDTSIAQYDFTQTYAAQKFRLTHGLTTNLLNRKHHGTDGRLNAMYKFTPSWQLRSQFNYDIYPHYDFNSVQGELRYQQGHQFSAAGSINRNLKNHGTRYGAQASYDFGKFTTGLNVDWEKDDGLRAFLRTTMSMAPYGENGDYILNSKSLANRSALNSRVFLDKNYNNVFDQDDEVIEDAQLNIGRRTTSPSNDKGMINYLGGPTNSYENVTLNLDSLENPYLTSDTAGYNTLLRAGTAPFMEFPVIETGLIDGFISTEEEALSGVKIQLVQDGQVIDITTTAYDGYYVFEYIRPGKYLLQFDPSYEHIRVPPRPILVTSENLFQYGIDFHLLEQTDEAACIEASETGSDGRITQDCHGYLIQAGTEQSAHSLFAMAKIEATVNQVRVGKYPDHVQVTLGLSGPTGYRVIHAKDNKEVTVLLPNADWSVDDPQWNDDGTSKVLRGLTLEKLPSGGTRVIFKAVDTVQVTTSALQDAEDGSQKQIYFHLTR